MWPILCGAEWCEYLCHRPVPSQVPVKRNAQISHRSGHSTSLPPMSHCSGNSVCVCVCVVWVGVVVVVVAAAAAAAAVLV